MWIRVCVTVLLLLVGAMVVVAGVPVAAGVAWAVLIIAGLFAQAWNDKRALRRASAELEKALAPEGAVAATHGEARFVAVLNDLKARQGGGDVLLASTPIYVTLGARQSGKRTLLQHAGLTWAAREVRSVGGCSWWVANECAVVQASDIGRARSTLDALYRFRPETPVSGFLVALNLEDLVTLPENALRAQAKALRADLDAAQQVLHTRAPVYLIVTKCDKLVGFVETFTGLPAQTRERIWGKSFPRVDTATASEQIIGQLDALVQAVGQELFTFIGQDSEQTARERVFQFPEQLASLRSPLLSWANAFFATSHRRAAPGLRGMFFASAQKGSYAYDRVSAPLFGATTARTTTGPGHSGPYFTQSIFPRGVLPDAAYRTAVAASNDHVLARQVAIAASLALALLPLLPYSQNVWELARTRQVIEEGAQQEAGADAKLASLSSLDRLRDQIETLRAASLDAPTLNVESGLDQSAAMHAAVQSLYLRVLRDSVLEPMVAADGQQLLIFAERHANDYTELTDREFKTYFDKLRVHLLLSGYYEPGEHMFDDTDAAWLTDVLSRRWAHGLDYEFDTSVQSRMAEHIAFYLQERKSNADLLLARDINATAETRQVLARVPEATIILEEAMDGADAYALTLGQVVGDSTVPLLSDGQVPGGYTRDGWENVVSAQLRHLQVANNGWVLGAEKARATQDYLVNEGQTGLRAEYWNRYLAQWRGFVAAVHIVPPRDPSEAATIATKLVDLGHVRQIIGYNFAGSDVPTALGSSVRDLQQLQPLTEQIAALKTFGAPEYGSVRGLVQRLR